MSTVTNHRFTFSFSGFSLKRPPLFGPTCLAYWIIFWTHVWKTITHLEHTVGTHICNTYLECTFGTYIWNTKWIIFRESLHMIRQLKVFPRLCRLTTLWRCLWTTWSRTSTPQWNHFKPLVCALQAQVRPSTSHAVFLVKWTCFGTLWPHKCYQVIGLCCAGAGTSHCLRVCLQVLLLGEMQNCLTPETLSVSWGSCEQFRIQVYWSELEVLNRHACYTSWEGYAWFWDALQVILRNPTLVPVFRTLWTWCSKRDVIAFELRTVL